MVSRERGGPYGILPDPRGSSLGLSLCQEQSSENLEKVPRESGKWKVLEVQDNEPGQ